MRIRNKFFYTNCVQNQVLQKSFVSVPLKLKLFQFQNRFSHSKPCCSPFRFSNAFRIRWDHYLFKNLISFKYFSLNFIKSFIKSGFLKSDILMNYNINENLVQMNINEYRSKWNRPETVSSSVHVLELFPFAQTIGFSLQEWNEERPSGTECFSTFVKHLYKYYWWVYSSAVFAEKLYTELFTEPFDHQRLKVFLQDPYETVIETIPQ